MTLYKNKNGEQIALTAEEIAEYNSRQPSEADILDVAKVSQKQIICDAREDYQYSDITFESNEYTCTFKAQSKLFAMVEMTPGDLTWRLADDETWVVLTNTQALALRAAVIARETAAYQHESTKFIAIDSALTVEDVEAIVWSL